ncbi:MAG: hypothetical protein WAV00_22840 [Nocardioides sp.]
MRSGSRWFRDGRQGDLLNQREQERGAVPVRRGLACLLNQRERERAAAMCAG